MLTQIYGCAGILTNHILTMLLMRYVFLIPTLPKRWMQALYMTLGGLVCTATAWFFGVTPSLVVLGLVVALYLCLTEEGVRRRLLGMLRVIPVLGIGYGLLMTPRQLPVLLFRLDDRSVQIYSLVIYGVVAVGFLVFAVRGRRWRSMFREDIASRHLQYWEKVLLYVIGSLMFLYGCTVGQGHLVLDETYRRAVLPSYIISALIGFAVTLTIILLILQGNKQSHIQGQVLKMQHNIIVMMADIVENRDKNTGGHIKRTATYVQIIALTLKAEHLYSNILTDQYIRDMYIAAPLHDIGKIHIPDAVLKKEGRFTEEEYEIMKSHAAAGRELLAHAETTLGSSSYLEIAQQMAGYHHEWWNGRGYPEGRRGQDIPLCARIMAVADVFDAIVSERCYKGAMQIDDAIALIQKESGTHFDPVIVDAFLEARDEITEVCLRFRDHPESDVTPS
ncbi:MAG: HD-GYP domain-containing protein [Oscillospiraceae bacterium]|nr:HD-GYP domain-containing protein [Oscillospiraceae bacterium]